MHWFFFVKLIQIYGSVANASRSDKGDMGSIPGGWHWVSLAIVGGIEPVSALTCALLYCCTPSLYFFFLDLFSDDLALTEFKPLT